MADELTLICTAYEPSEAICIQSFLESRDIFCFVENENHIRMSSGVLALALGGYRIKVISIDAPEAVALLRSANCGELFLDDAIDLTGESLSLCG